MIETFIKEADHIYVACGITDFRKQIDTLCAMVIDKFKLDPYTGSSVFIFCNRKRNAIKVLRFEDNGFILAHKKLIDVDKMKFQWPKNETEVKDITLEQLRWLLQGLNIEQKTALKKYKISKEDVVF
ncbi:IS66 family insertion sequence element accessory protein TnpB [Sedimentibacter sp.]|uniref:IS66 family insertion sequence element accessory protein TnpB n=1 Tax=Sedimentibacter sp. TaxID=1960295 RepID=UPI0028A6B670|nr:IS66 family insertion sequence element accessory protein TnpB [Sedimentibacter sp.]